MRATSQLQSRSKARIVSFAAVVTTVAAVLISAPSAQAAECTVTWTSGTVSALQTQLNAQAAICTSAGDTVIVDFTSNWDMAGNGPLTWSANAGLRLQGNVTIDGSGAQILLASGSVSRGVVTIQGLSFTNGVNDTGYGGAIEASSRNLTVNNSTFSANGAVAPDETDYGGAIAGYGGGALTVTNSAFENSFVASQGGAIYWEGNATIASSTFTTNDAAFEGGAIYHDNSGADGVLTVSSSAFNDNSGEPGGAIFSSGLAVNVTDSTFTQNTTAGQNATGGAISVDGANLTVASSTFTQNSASPSISATGGAIYGVNSDMVISTSTFDGNTSTGDAGGVFGGSGGAALTITETTFKNNEAGYEGGAVKAMSGISASNSTFSENSATGHTNSSKGGAIHGEGITLINSTVEGNRADGSGGGIYASAGLELYFVTLWSNTAPNGPSLTKSSAAHDMYLAATVIGNPNPAVPTYTAGNCDVATGDDEVTQIVVATHAGHTGSDLSCDAPSSAATQMSIADVDFGALADNGGPTWTLLPGDNSGLIDFVTDPSALALTSEDQRGFARSGDYTAGAVQWAASAPEPDLTQLPPSWYQAYERESAVEVCLAGWNPSWAEWPSLYAGGWTCEKTIWWDVRRTDWTESAGFDTSQD